MTGDLGSLVRRASLTLPEPRPVPFRWWILAALAVALLARDPADWLRPQFNAEEGAVFFQQAYNDGGLHSLFSSESGYYHLALRLTAALALLVPLELAPAVFKLVAFAIQMLPVAYLLADGVAGFVSAPLLRVAAAALYVAGPNSIESYLNVNNAQWHLTFTACLILLSRPPHGPLRRMLDAGVLVLFAFSGPYSLICSPLAIWSLLRPHPGGVRGWRDRCGPGIVLAGAVLQLAYLVAGTRISGAAGVGGEVSFTEILRILSTHGVLNSFFGMYGTARHIGEFPAWAHPLAAAALLLLPVAAILLRNGALLVLAALAAASVATLFLFPLNDLRRWLEPDFGPRYFLFTTLSVLATLLAMVDRGGWPRAAAILLLATALVFGVRGDYRIPAALDTHWREQVAAFRALPEGSSFFIPVHPQPTYWGLTLVKRGEPSGPGVLQRYPRTAGRFQGVARIYPGERLADGPTVKISGAAVDAGAAAPAGAVFLVVGGKVFPAVTGVPMPFAAQYVKIPALTEAGFSRVIPEKELGPGTHLLEILALDSTGTRLLGAGPSQEFTVPLAAARWR